MSYVMFSHRLAGAVWSCFLIFAVLLVDVSYAADDLFVVRNKLDMRISGQQKGQLDRFISNPLTRRADVVDIRFDVLDKATANFNPPEGVSLLLQTQRIEKRSGQDFTWYAKPVESPLGSAVLVVRNGRATGTVRTPDKLYWVRPLDSTAHVLIEINESAFPPEHPPGYNEMEGSSAKAFDRISVLADTAAASCRPITVLVAYTSQAEAQAGNIQDLIQLAVDETNQSYVNSQINTSIQLVHAYRTSYTEAGSLTDRDRFRTRNDGIMDEVHALRDQHAADVAVLMTANGDACGVAFNILARDESEGFATVSQQCATGYYSFGHEIGHLQGARHNPEADPSTLPFPHGHGYFNAPAHWRTVMSYDCPGGCKRLPYWSNPMVSYGGGPTGTAARHDNHRVLNETSCHISGFRASLANEIDHGMPAHLETAGHRARVPSGCPLCGGPEVSRIQYQSPFSAVGDHVHKAIATAAIGSDVHSLGAGTAEMRPGTGM